MLPQPRLRFLLADDPDAGKTIMAVRSHGVLLCPMAVRIYSTPTCTFCDQLKSYLRQRSVKFVEYDVSRDERKAGEMLHKSRQTAVPVLDFHGTIVVGFDKPRVDRLIAKYR